MSFLNVDDPTVFLFNEETARDPIEEVLDMDKLPRLADEGTLGVSSTDLIELISDSAIDVTVLSFTLPLLTSELFEDVADEFLASVELVRLVVFVIGLITGRVVVVVVVVGLAGCDVVCDVDGNLDVAAKRDDGAVRREVGAWSLLRPGPIDPLVDIF